jgi:hypothetical protein
MIQFRRLPDGRLDVSSFTHPGQREVNMPDSETLNIVMPYDIEVLKRTFPRFLDAVERGPGNLRRAIRLFEEGYAEVFDPILQLLVWVMGIEAAFAEGDKPLRRPQLLEAIEKRVSFDLDIFEDPSHQAQFLGSPEPVILRETIRDLFHLRNQLVHGGWIGSDLNAKDGRRSISGGNIPYPDILRETASFVLRKSILSILSDRNI